ncbi:uncharacterized protein LOC134831895 [Culicoides brevitarsis]|uniref:uncharacterized protein LOC134831895 n=1 Tax=Culicoides brevitarsis TaxID=469753 RepID=UPI00307C4269
MASIKTLSDAVKAENIEKVKEFLEIDPNEPKRPKRSTCLFYEFHEAIRSGNLEITKIFVECWTSGLYEPNYLGFDTLTGLLDQNYAETKKLEFLQYLLPQVLAKYPNSDHFKDILDVVLRYCVQEHYLLVDYLMNLYYSEEQNTLFPLLKELQNAIDDCQPLSIFLHSKIRCLIHFFAYYYNNDMCLFWFFYEMGKTFAKLLRKNTPETTKLAAKIMKVLLDKNFSKVFKTLMDACDSKMLDNGETDTIMMLQKRIFQAIYYLDDDPATETKIFDISHTWFQFLFGAKENDKLFSETFKCLVPFLIKQEHLFEMAILLLFCNKREVCDLDELVNYNNARERKTLQEKCRDLIRQQISSNVETGKDFVNQVWALPLPKILKCSLLGIPNADWMSDLEMN